MTSYAPTSTRSASVFGRRSVVCAPPPPPKPLPKSLDTMILHHRHINELLQLNYTITAEALTSIEASSQLDDFLESARRHGLRKKGPLSSITSMVEVTESVKRIHDTLSLISGSSSNVSYMCKRFMRSVRVCQRFIRRALLRRRREKESAKTKWIAMQDSSRKALETIVKARLKHTKQSGVADDLWGIALDCYVSPEDMDAALGVYFREVSRGYRKELAHQRMLCHAAMAASNMASPHRRRCMAEFIQKYPPMCAVANLSPDIAQLCLAFAHAQSYDGYRTNNTTSIMRRHSSTFASCKPDFTAATVAADGPVSYYHALLTMGTWENIQLLLAMRIVSSSLNGDYTVKPGGPSRYDFTRAEEMQTRWNTLLGRRTPAATAAGSPRSTERRAPPRRNADGRPSSRINCGSQSVVLPVSASPRPVLPRTIVRQGSRIVVSPPITPVTLSQPRKSNGRAAGLQLGSMLVRHSRSSSKSSPPHTRTLPRLQCTEQQQSKRY